MKTTFVFSIACALAVIASAQTAPPAFPAPLPAEAKDAALRAAVRQSIATGSNVVIKPAVPTASLPAAPAVANSPALAAQPPPVIEISPTAPPTASPGAPPALTAPGAPPPAGSSSLPPGVSPVPQPAGPPAMQPPPLSEPAGAGAAPSDPAQPVDDLLPIGTVDWTDATLPQVFEIYQKLTGRTVLRPGNLPAPGSIVLTLAAPMTRKEVIQALHSVLAMNGISMIPVGEKFVKAVPMTQVNQEGAPFQRLGEEFLPELGPYVTHMVQLKYARPSELLPVLQLFSKVQNGILPIDSSQVIVLRDYTENVKRMLELIKEVDVVVPSEFVSEVIPIKYAMAADIASALNSLSSGGGGTSVGGTGAGTGVGGRTGARTGVGGSRGGFGLGALQQPGMTGATPYGNVPGQVGQPGGQPSFTDRLQSIIKKASTATGSSDVLVLGPTKIIADERANALLVFASRLDMSTITNIVAKLDVVLPQVLIESVIMDVQLGDGYSFGVSYLQRPQQAGDFTGVGGINNLNAFSDAGFGSFTNMTRGFNYYARFGQDLDVVVNASANDSRVTVIQRPRIMTFHAKPASFFIGNTVPYVTSTSYYGGYGYGGGPSSQYQQLRVGIQLDVTPYINQDGLVVMEINEQIEEISGSTAIENVGDVPNTASRTLSAQVAVKDRETIILGGFIRSSEDKSKSGVPILKDLPVFGLLFNKTSHTKERKELLVLMRPTVLRTPEAAAAETAAEKLRLPGISRAEAEEKRMEEKTTETMKRELAEEEMRDQKEKAKAAP